MAVRLVFERLQATGSAVATRPAPTETVAMPHWPRHRTGQPAS
jgi:hypothetical protein